MPARPGFGLALGAMLLVCSPVAAEAQHELEREVLYHIFVRSFRDSNADHIGDVRGIQDQLGYLHDLGVTSLLLTPINPSPFYHNYFASRFDGVDSVYGDSAALAHLIAAVHQRGMKIYLDQEIQYAVGDNPWWTESQGAPHSRYGRFILYKDSANTQPESAVFGITLAPMYNGTQVALATVNLREPGVRDYFAELFASMVDPNHDGKFADGVDGFRIDHMMDTLDQKPQLANLFADFWSPVFARARGLNPAVKIIAEQADWGYGDDFLTRGGADLVFAFPIRAAILSLDRTKLIEALDETTRRTPAGRGQIVFLENHDTDRFASVVEADPRRLRLGAALNVLLKGTPLIYYGQELGMQGRQSKLRGTDGNDIPVREAMEWNRGEGGLGSAEWYRDTGPWWTDRFTRSNDGISVEEQRRDPTSLLSYYRRLLALRRSRPEIQQGEQRVLSTAQPGVLAVLRSMGPGVTLMLANLDSSATTLPVPTAPGINRQRFKDLLGHRSGATIPDHVTLPPYGVLVLGN